MQTSRADIHRRRSTFSFRKILASAALTMKVREAEAGATRLASPQERAVSRLKKPTAMHPRPIRKCRSRKILPTTARMPLRVWSSSRSPMRFMALESRTSPALEAKTIMPIALHSLSGFMLLPWLTQHLLVVLSSLGLRLSQSRAAGHPAYAATDEQNADPAKSRYIL